MVDIFLIVPILLIKAFRETPKAGFLIQIPLPKLSNIAPGLTKAIKTLIYSL